MIKKSLLLINLGSPESPNDQDVGNYLTEFLTDKYVIDIPYLLRQILVRFLIVPKRKSLSAEKYQKVWQEDGSPLIIYTKKFTKKIKDILKDIYTVEFAMRYGNPSIRDGLLKLKEHDIIEVLPLYPHDTKSSVITAIEAVKKEATKLGIIDKISFLPIFYKEQFFLEPLTNTLKGHNEYNQFEHILFSYHGLPQHHLPKQCEGCQSPCHNEVNISECYRAQCYETTRLVAEKLNIPKDKYSSSFQSRLGNKPWIRPYSDHVIDDLKNKYKHIAVMTPSFVADCLETIEEVGMEFKDQFEAQSTDHKLTRISCLNDNEQFAKLLCDYIQAR
jgi:ferrochelatase